ncbi:MAG: thiamine-phosphate synthase family protein [Candidatus Heimdallarchaeaceae archaeon]
MRFPCEYVAASFLPTIRQKVAHILRDMGLSQTAIAEKLKVKQPVIVSYLKKDPKIENSFLDYYTDELAKEVAKMLYENQNLSKIMRKICTSCMRLRMDGAICEIHKTMVPEIAHIQHCTICRGEDLTTERNERFTVINQLSTAFNELKSIPNFAYWVPEIGAQLAHCSENAKRIDEVASFPGRIIKIHDDVEVLRSPEFGASKTMSRLLIWIRNFQPSLTWCISIKNRPELKTKLNKNDIKFLETKKIDQNWEEVLESLSHEETINEINALVDSGSPGYEAIAYLFASSTAELFSLIKRICDTHW